MKKYLYIVSCIFAVFILMAASAPQDDYIRKYAAKAVAEMYRSGVPASITLAQGMLESRYGQSALATEGNNHFGIKCHKDWKGKTMKVDDDEKGECFRVYDKVDDSFADHSDFLRYRDRYKFLFDYEITDYKAWAHGLKKAGYATNPQYAPQLIDIIERYELYKYDTVEQGYVPEPVNTETKADRKKGEKTSGKSGEKEQVKKEQVKKEQIPQSPNALEEAVAYKPVKGEEFTFDMVRVLAKNDVPFVYSMDGETYASIAKDNGLMLKEILRYNDLSSQEELLPGTIVYLEFKKSQSPKGLDKYIVESDGESFHDICQRFAVKESAIRKLNGFGKGQVALREGDTILLRKQSRK